VGLAVATAGGGATVGIKVGANETGAWEPVGATVKFCVGDGGAAVGTAVVPAVGVEVGLAVATAGGGATVGDDGADVGVAVGAPVCSIVTVRICDG
jgi:hypothetical protein